MKNLGRQQEALNCYKQAIQANPKIVNARINLAGLLNNLQKLDEALQVLDEAIILDPTNSIVLNNKGLTLVNKKDFYGSLVCFEKATKLDTNFVLAYANKAQVEY